MPGLYGGHLKGPRDVNRQMMMDMSGAMSHGRDLRIDKYEDEKVGVFAGRASLGILNSVDQPANCADSAIRLFLHGELLREEALIKDPQWLLQAYLQEGDHVFGRLNGMFHVMIYDPNRGQIRLVTDRFGLQPLYYTTLDNELLFAGEIKALLCHKGTSRTPDESGLADFFHFGQVLGNKSLFKDIHLLPPASVLSYDVNSGHLQIESYWDLLSIFSEKGCYSPSAQIDDAASLLADAIRANAGQTSKLGLSLSGGLDSRGILAGLQEKAKGLGTYTLGLPGCSDQKLAEQMAEIGGTVHEFIELKQNYIANFEQMARDMIYLSDGLYHPHESTEMLALEYFKKAPFNILLRGHGGEVAKAALAYPVMVRPEAYDCRSRQDILGFIYNATNLLLGDVPQDKLFTPAFADVMATAPQYSLAQSCGEAADKLAPADVCIFYYIREHVRRQVVASLNIFRSQIEIRMPYLDATYMEKLLELPVSSRNQGEIHVALVRQCMPELIKVINSNTGVPLDAGPLRLYVTDKFNSVMRRLSIPGFRHYTEFQDWHRKGFRNSSQEIIFSEQTASRGRYNMDYLKTVFDRHMSGKGDYGYLLGTIVGLELWQRMFAD